MKKIFILITSLISFTLCANATTFTGEVTKVGEHESNQIIDAQTKQGVEFAKISIPQKNFRTYSDANGNFELPKIQITQDTVIDIEKEGYRPFSLTINKGQDVASTPMKIEIAKSEAMDVTLETNSIHLGDNSFSGNSANASEFKLPSGGPYYSKDFIMTQNAKKSSNYLVIGSIIGLDTKEAKLLGQNRIKTGAYSTPTEIFFNGQKIGEVKINGDNQKIKIPNPLIKADARNQITIKTGVNTSSRTRIDYDDIEIVNLSVLSE